jgi:hypothetical protein
MFPLQGRDQRRLILLNVPGLRVGLGLSAAGLGLSRRDLEKERRGS